MSADLTGRLGDAEEALSRSVPPAGAELAARVHATVARRRRLRHVREAAGALAVVVVVGGATWAVANPDAPSTPPVASPAPVVTAEPSPSPTASPSLPPTADAGPVVREDQIDDATVLARLREPRTGEVWTAPERAADLEQVLSPADSSTVWRVGRHGDSDIAVVVEDAGLSDGTANLMGVPVLGLYEVDGSGARAVVCPSARTTDACTARTGDPDVHVTLDRDTFYDTMTLPASIALADGWTLTTVHTTSTGYYPYDVLGDGAVLYGVAGDVTVAAELGALQVVEVVRPGVVTGLTDHRYAIRTPYGTLVELAADDAPGGEFAAIQWDDGVARTFDDTYDDAWGQSTAPSSGACFAGTFSVEDVHVGSDWRAAGTTPSGQRVYVPVEGGNPVSRAVRAWQEESSGTIDDATGEWLGGAAAGYRYTTDEAFLDAHSLYAIEGPTGDWQLRLRGDAGQIVYECA